MRRLPKFNHYGLFQRDFLGILHLSYDFIASRITSLMQPQKIKAKLLTPAMVVEINTFRAENDKRMEDLRKKYAPAAEPNKPKSPEEKKK